jgi:cytidylate kinase
MLITISREYGAGGARVAQRVADALGWRLVDNELVELVARKAGCSAEHVARREERVPTFVERLARTLAAASPELFLPPNDEGTVPRLREAELVKVTEAVVQEIAEQGRVVVVGRGAPVVLARARNALHIRVVAPRSYRIRNVSERHHCDAAEAERIMDETDRMRGAYHRQHDQRDWADPVLYHMVLNTAPLGIDGAADLVLASARALGWR